MAKKAEIKKKVTGKKTTPKTKSSTITKKAAAPKKAVAPKSTAPKKRTTKKTVVPKSAAPKKSITKKAVAPKSSTPKKSITKKAAVVKKATVKAVVKKKVSTKKAKGYTKKELLVFKKVILEKRSKIIHQLQNLKDQMMDSTTGQYVNENSPYSLHMAEQGTDAQEREKLYLWAQRESKFLAYLEDALIRIENGTYGLCIECIDEPKNLCPTCPLIPKPRLLAVPHTQHCVEIKNAASKK
ncbi:MAG: conjugal transfer protein TraR [Melioribacteraceae bacterium]|nr:conjugal transfer protein TraR [Melioribacteraceae bacterium]